MKTILPHIMVLLLLGCAHTVPHQSPSAPILSHPAPEFPKKITAYETAAWHLFRNSDYVRALRFAYQAAEMHPQEPSAKLLVGLIYDHGFDRPDLAMAAYNHILQQAPNYAGVDILQPRLPYLFRRTQERVAQLSLQQGAQPLSSAPLALFPIVPWTQNKTQAALGLGLTDILFSGFLDGESTLPSLRTHLLAHAFLTAFPNADANTFAKWVGATHTLSGTLVQSQNHQISISLKLINAQGHTAHTFAPIMGNMNDLESLSQEVIQTVSQALELSLPSKENKAPSSLALILHGQALDAYLAGDTKLAQKFSIGAMALAPKSDRIAWFNKWIEKDDLGGQIGGDLITLYRSLKFQPDPDEASARRILATQQLLTPTSGLDTAKEPLQPFKSPQTEPSQ